MSIVYDPSKTPQEMADAAGVSLAQVRNFLQRNTYCNYRVDRANYLRKIVESYFSMHPSASKSEAAAALNLTIPTINKYLHISIEKKDNSTSGSTSKRLSVGSSDGVILRNIIDIYLPQKRTFDCDLTFGLGKFYASGLPVPEYRFDKYLFGESGSKQFPTVSLDEVEHLQDECFDSIIVDLPICIDNSNSGVNAFESLNSMLESYNNMLSISLRLLKKDGILVFKSSDFVLRNDAMAFCSGQWATDHAIDNALKIGFDLTDRFILANRQLLSNRSSTKIRTGLKHGCFLVFTKK